MLVVQAPAGERRNWTAIGERAVEAMGRLRGDQVW
jgi:hypothetical protein